MAAQGDQVIENPDNGLWEQYHGTFNSARKYKVPKEHCEIYNGDVWFKLYRSRYHMDHVKPDDIIIKTKVVDVPVVPQYKTYRYNLSHHKARDLKILIYIICDHTKTKTIFKEKYNRTPANAKKEHYLDFLSNIIEFELPENELKTYLESKEENKKN